MLVLQLRWLLLGLFLTVVAAVFLALWLDRRRVRRRAAETFADAALHTVLEHAPFGWMVLESAERYVYANAYARRLLELEASAGRSRRWSGVSCWMTTGPTSGEDGPRRAATVSSTSPPAGPSAGG